MNYYHLKSTDDRVYMRVPRNRYTHAFRTEISAMASATGWSESKCVNYVNRRLQQKQSVSVEITHTFNFSNRLMHK